MGLIEGPIVVTVKGAASDPAVETRPSLLLCAGHVKHPR